MLSTWAVLIVLGNPEWNPRITAQQARAHAKMEEQAQADEVPGAFDTEPPLVNLPRQATPAISAEALSRGQLLGEIEEKTKRVRAFLGERGYDALVLTQVRNFAWMTAGIADNQIVLGSEKGASSLVITKDGRRFVVASVSELPRLAAESLSGLGYEPKGLAWTDTDLGGAVKRLVASDRVASDTNVPGLETVDIVALRAPLTDTEVVKLRWVAKHTADAVVEVIESLSPGVSERSVEARTSNALLRRNLRPTVLLVGTDERIQNYRHTPPTDFATLENDVQITVCAKRWGLTVAMTRLVHFGDATADMQRKLTAAARVSATLQSRLKPGKTAAELFAVMAQTYADSGFPDEWRQHHQGGAIGYSEREWFALPQGSQRVAERQAFVWNPTVQGTKVEDTVLVTKNGVENLTLTEGWPSVTTLVDGKSIRSPAILIKSAATARR